MKNIVKIFTLLIISFLAYTSMNAQCPTPDPSDYPGYPYTYGGTRIIVLSQSPLCRMQYEYCWRTTPCCHDFWVGTIKLLDPGCSPQIKQDIHDHIQKYIDYAMADVIVNVNPWCANVPDCSEGWSEEAFRQGHGGCYTDWYYNMVSGCLEKYPCEVVVENCFQATKVCWYWNTECQCTSIRKEDRGVWMPECPPLGGPNNDLHCNPVCEMN